MKLTNKNNLPLPVYLAVQKFDAEYKAGSFPRSISTTTLIKPIQIVELTARHYDEIEEDVSNRLWALQGQILHGILEKAAPDSVSVEKRVAAEVLGWTVAGKYDLIEDGILRDYKYTSVWNYVFGNEEWEKQANVNWFLLHKNGVEIKAMKNTLMFRDFQDSRVGSRGYPQAMIIDIDIPMWGLERAEKYVADRVRLFQDARQKADSMLPLCSDDDRWLNQKTNVYRRCEKYCPVRNFCAQVKNGGKVT
jgi:hypothetical protein